jgi:hypothetical protein
MLGPFVNNESIVREFLGRNGWAVLKVGTRDALMAEAPEHAGDAHRFIVEVWGCSREQAETVLADLLENASALGSPYRVRVVTGE